MRASARKTAAVELEQDPTYEQTASRVARVVWVLLLAVMIATLLGLFGGGPLSRATVVSPDGAARLEYERFIRFGSATRITLQAMPGTPATTVDVVLGREFVDAVRVENQLPVPVESVAAADGIRYRFAASGGGPVRIELDLVPVRRWRVEGQARINGTVLRWVQTVYP